MNTTIEEGLKLILGHLEEPLLWPRPISTRRTGGAQISVDNTQQALAWYKAANLLDCRISAYPKYTDYYINMTGIAPTLLLADIDKSQFESSELFELASTQTLKFQQNTRFSTHTVMDRWRLSLYTTTIGDCP